MACLTLNVPCKGSEPESLAPLFQIECSETYCTPSLDHTIPDHQNVLQGLAGPGTLIC